MTQELGWNGVIFDDEYGAARRRGRLGLPPQPRDEGIDGRPELRICRLDQTAGSGGELGAIEVVRPTRHSSRHATG